MPNGWILTGAPSTNCVQATTGGQGGRSAVELKGDGTTTTIALSQNIAANGNVQAATVYGVSVWLKIGGTMTSGSTFSVTISGTGVTTQTIYSADPSTLTTSYQQFHLFFASQNIVPPSNYSVNITWASANASGGSSQIYIADLVLCLPTAYGSVQYAIFRGSTDFATGDGFVVETEVTSSGVFQRKRFASREVSPSHRPSFQFPSSASPTISDSLALSDRS